MDDNLISDFLIDKEVLNTINRILKQTNCDDVKEDILFIMLSVAKCIAGGSVSLAELSLVGECLISFSMHEKYHNLISKIKRLSEFRGIVTIARIYGNGNRLEAYDLYPYLLWLLDNDNLNAPQYILVEKLLKSRLIYYNKDNLEEILALIKCLDINTSIEEVNIIYNILVSPIFLSCEKEDYRKLVYLCLSTNLWRFLHIAFNDIFLDRDKLFLLVNYYYQMAEYCVSIDNFESSVFRVPLMDKMIWLDSSLYKQRLNDILTNKNSEIAARIISLDDTWGNIDVLLNKLQEFGMVAFPLVKNVSNTFLSPIVRSLDNGYLDLVLGLVLEYNEEKSGEKRSLIDAKLSALEKILGNTIIYQNNKVRLDYVIKIILELDSEIVIDSIATFASSIKSVYYTDLEFREVILVLMDTSDLIGRVRPYESSYFILNSLFINEGVPFVCKNTIIEMAKSMDRKTILEFSERLHVLGVKMRNLYGLNYGIGDNGIMNIKEVKDGEFLRELLKKE